MNHQKGKFYEANSVALDSPNPNSVAWSPDAQSIVVMDGYSKLDVYMVADGRHVHRVPQIEYLAGNSNLWFLNSHTVAFPRTVYGEAKVPRRAIIVADILTGAVSPIATDESSASNSGSPVDQIIAVSPSQDFYIIAQWLSGVSPNTGKRGYLRITFYDGKSGSVISATTVEDVKTHGFATSARFSHDSSLVALCTNRGWVFVYDAKVGKLVNSFDAYPAARTPCRGIAFSPNGNLIATGRDNSTLGPKDSIALADIWETRSGKHVGGLPATSGSDRAETVLSTTFGLDWSFDDNLALANGSAIRIWTNASANPSLDLEEAVEKDPGHYGAIDLSFSRDGRLAVTGNSKVLMFSRRQ